MILGLDAKAQTQIGETSRQGELALDFVLTEESTERGIGEYVLAVPGMGAGAIAVDFDNDADIDILVPQGADRPDAVYQNDGTGHFIDVASSLGVDSMVGNRAMLMFDADGDRRGDLFVFNDDLNQESFIRYYKQISNGTFADITGPAGLLKQNTPPADHPGHIGGAAAADINNDGHLDLFVAMWGESNSMFLNNGDGSFLDISASSGLAGEETGLYWQPLFHDFDGDGWMDLLLNVDEGPNELMINQGDGTFVDVAAAAGADPHMNCMGTCVIDFDGDRDLDVFITNVFNLQGDGEHDILYRNESTPQALEFFDVSFEEKVVTQDNWGWGCTWADFDNNGVAELVETNGWFWAPWDSDPSRLFQRRPGQPGFRDVASASGYLHYDYGSCVIAADLNRDGRLDLVETTMPRDLKLFVNSEVPGSASHHYLVVKPRLLDQSNYRAIGAVVDVQVGGCWQSRLITAGTSLLGQEPAEAHFGLGPYSVVDRVVVRFPDGRVSDLTNVNGDQVIVVTP